MRRGVTGTGSASMLLIFTVLCMAVFSLISLSSARTDSAMTDSWQAGVEAYYAADLLAERVLCAILASSEPIYSAYGIELCHNANAYTGERIISYACRVDDNRLLCVSVALHENGYSLREWRLISTDYREPGETITLYSGE